MSAMSDLARELHGRFHPQSRYLTCEGCKVAARALLTGRTRVPRARRAKERMETLRADQLDPTEHRGRIVQAPGNRGYLTFAGTSPGGPDGVYVATTTGVAVYPVDTEFRVWGP